MNATCQRMFEKNQETWEITILRHKRYRDILVETRLSVFTLDNFRYTVPALLTTAVSIKKLSFWPYTGVKIQNKSISQNKSLAFDIWCKNVRQMC